jgi:hypothetical protein
VFRGRSRSELCSLWRPSFAVSSSLSNLLTYLFSASKSHNTGIASFRHALTTHRSESTASSLSGHSIQPCSSLSPPQTTTPYYPEPQTTTERPTATSQTAQSSSSSSWLPASQWLWVLPSPDFSSPKRTNTTHSPSKTNKCSTCTGSAAATSKT